MKPVEIDYHSHILPCLDDGAKDLDEALEMALTASRLGFKTIVATPHFEEGFFKNYRDVVLHGVNELNKGIKKAGIPIVILPGSEIMLSLDTPVLLQKKMLMTVMDEGTHVLVELPFSVQPIWTESIINRIKEIGLTPIFAHPERYAWSGSISDAVKKLRLAEVQIQGNLSSFAGKYGGKTKTAIEKLEKHSLINYWGSDAHSVLDYQVLGKHMNRKDY